MTVKIKMLYKGGLTLMCNIWIWLKTKPYVLAKVWKKVDIIQCKVGVIFEKVTRKCQTF